MMSAPFLVFLTLGVTQFHCILSNFPKLDQIGNLECQIFQNWIKLEIRSALIIQTGPFAALGAHLYSDFSNSFIFIEGSLILITAGEAYQVVECPPVPRGRLT